ncbi:UPF0481 protein At3g47200-like isoform X3 [Papaver somniferum]|uniref:UPF0481 protein At3g47200-like isoform X3 n=1 Tax=Papaver somniferum TaxID=3469 RepID=UPI000E6FF738|nr:UPF0481 protein At3g47200-like isoform X3 [Papaver somniferum]
MPQWVIDIKQEETDELDFGKSWTIYRVPTNLLEVQKNAFIPKIISIGPFYYRDARYKVMEEHKKRFLFLLLGYDNKDQGGGYNYVELDSIMMVMDGCFVIELLRLYHKFCSSDTIEGRRRGTFSFEKKVVDDPIFTTRWMLRALQRDLMMIQNQLPFFLLQELYRLITASPRKGCDIDNVSLIDLTLKFFDPLLPKDESKSVDVDPDPNEYRHLLHLFRKSFILPIKRRKPLRVPRTGSTVAKPIFHYQQTTPSTRTKQDSHFIQCVTELREAGVTFLEKPEHANIDMFAVEYKNGVLKIPPLFIDDNTVPLFLNFIAYEQCDKDATPYFTNHFMFFDRLVSSIKDVEVLHRTGIIHHVFGSDKKVADFINKLCREIVYNVDNCHLSEQMKGVNDYYKGYYANKWNVWWTRLLRDYFSSPWTVLSLLAASVLLMFTAGQTFFALLICIDKIILVDFLIRLQKEKWRYGVSIPLPLAC